MAAQVSSAGKAWRIVRFLLRHIFALAFFALLLAIAAIIALDWLIGIRGIIPLISDAAIPLGLLAVVLILWLLKARIAATIRRSQRTMAQRAARQAVREGMDQGETMLKAAAAGTSSRLSAMGRQISANLREAFAGKQAATTSQPVAPRCPFCRRIVRAGAHFCDSCGKELPTLCPRCGRPLRPKAKFCDGCGGKAG